MNSYRRLNGLSQDKTSGLHMLNNIDDKYNSTEHNTIQIKPNEAVNKENHLWVCWHLQNAAKNNRKYEEIKEGQMVRIMIKQTSLIKHTCQAGQVKHIKLLELIIIIFC